MCVSTNLKRFKRNLQERELIRLLRNTGVSRSLIQEIPYNFADRPLDPSETYYYYNGPLDEKTRTFCRLMLKIDKVFSQSEIDKISEELGYDVLEFCGAYNCRHQWIRFRGKRINTPKPTVREIRKLINDGIEVS